ncbi:endonuclease [Mycolicibacter minnesotensis]
MVRLLLRRAGTTYAQEAGIRLRNQPMPLFQLLMLCMLADGPIDAAPAARSAHELFKSGLRTAHKVLAADRQTVIDALHRGDHHGGEQGAVMLEELAADVQALYGGDLRVLSERSGRDVEDARSALRNLPGIGDTGASMFLCEVQDVWPWARSTFDGRALAAARELGLPADANELGVLSNGRNAELAAALVRYCTDPGVRARLAERPGGRYL